MLSPISALVLALQVPAGDAPQGQIREPLFEDLSPRWQAAMGELGVPGMAVVVLENETILHLECFGERNPVTHAPVTPATIFYIASATKPFVALAVLLLAEEGKVELDAPVRRYLPRFELADSKATESITVRDLLCHRPGLQSFPVVFLDAYTGEISEDRYYHFLKEVQPLGTTSYSNVHFTLAGRVIEAVSGQGWRDFLAQRIFVPCGMTRTTGYADRMYAEDDVAIPCVLGPAGPVPASVRKSDATMHAAGGLGTSIRDLAQWLRLQLARGRVNGERLVSEERMEEMFALQSKLPAGSSDGEGFGLGWQRARHRDQLLLEHGGGYVGTAAHVSFLPEAGLALAILVNTDGAGAALADVVKTDVYDRLLGEEPRSDRMETLRSRAARERKTRAAASPDPDTTGGALDLTVPLAACAGTFANEHWGTLHIEVEGEALRARIGCLRIELAPRERDEFTALAEGALRCAGRFEVADGRVRAALLELREGESVRFER